MDAIGQEMDIFETHRDITGDYRDYITSFIHIKNDRINKEALVRSWVCARGVGPKNNK